MIKTLVASGACALLCGCATPYQEMGLTGGVAATQLASDTFQITARGNGFTDPDTIQRYVMRKAAETTIAAGYDYFVLGSSRDRTNRMAFTSGSAYGGYGYASGFATTSSIIQPGETVIVKMKKAPAPDPLPDGWFDAHDVAKYLSSAAK